MKNLVVCCDGTWKSADDKDVSNIEKIARAVDPAPADLPMQIVYYAAGVGTGATKFEKLAGGAFGLGLDAAIVGAYRFLALNYQEGDQIYVFGFSRGAYTARSLAGMINAIGLLTPDGLVKNKLSKAMPLYRGRPADGEEPTPEWSEAAADFRADCYDKHDEFIRFLGVFDTVGTLGVPGVTRRKYQFHNVSLTPQVATARHALAIHERRRAFAPALWTENKKATSDVKQIWFDGVHSDVGGGYPESELANRSLKWMVEEARAAELAFVDSRLVTEPQEVVLHKTLKGPYRVLNMLSVVAVSFTTSGGSLFKRGWRVLQRPAVKDRGADVAVDLASEVYTRWVLDNGGSLPAAGVKRWIKGLGSERFETVAKDLETRPAG
ncbi:DUF2235 domain-containing protein [Nocardia sp. 348MFTsu5.1]|uniref:DUF2235 domain-containing protein n=1 Tax=Nocardia sp. 348MFTsu5.1 TaxID=1172185 RepID=UPI00035FF4BB|nr:DUF2235 domain-containing protein [Nocardia sp. 348MFTsu5.1]